MTIDNAVRVYQAPDLSSNVLACLPKGHQIELSARQEIRGHQWKID